MDAGRISETRCAPDAETAVAAAQTALAVLAPVARGALTPAGALALQRAAGNRAVARAVGSGRRVLARSPLPGFDQGQYESCGAASLLTQIMVWDKESKDAARPNELLIHACNLILAHMELNAKKLKVSMKWTGWTSEETFTQAFTKITKVRNLARASTPLTRDNYEDLAWAFLAVFGDKKGMDDAEIGALRKELGLTTSLSESASTLGGIFETTIVKSLVPGQSVQATWVTGEEGSEGAHAFSIGRFESGEYFMSDQGASPPVEIVEVLPQMLKSKTIESAEKGRSILKPSPPTIMPKPWTGVQLLAGKAGIRRAARQLEPGEFLAQIDAGWDVDGQNLHVWDFVSVSDTLAAAEASLAAYPGGHGGVIVERPFGVFTLNKTNPVSDKNVNETKIDASDSKQGILGGKKRHWHAWVILSTEGGKRGSTFKVF